MSSTPASSSTAPEPAEGRAPLAEEDVKLVTLARAARARTGAPQGAAVRDTDGRSYAACTVALPSLYLDALQVAVAMAVAAGAEGLEAAVLCGTSEPQGGGIAAVRDLGGDSVPVWRVRPDGTPVAAPRT